MERSRRRETAPGQSESVYHGDAPASTTSEKSPQSEKDREESVKKVLLSNFRNNVGTGSLTFNPVPNVYSRYHCSNSGSPFSASFGSYVHNGPRDTTAGDRGASNVSSSENSASRRAGRSAAGSADGTEESSGDGLLEGHWRGTGNSSKASDGGGRWSASLSHNSPLDLGSGRGNWYEAARAKAPATAPSNPPLPPPSQQQHPHYYPRMDRPIFLPVAYDREGGGDGCPFGITFINPEACHGHVPSSSLCASPTTAPDGGLLTAPSGSVATELNFEKSLCCAVGDEDDAGDATVNSVNGRAFSGDARDGNNNDAFNLPFFIFDAFFNNARRPHSPGSHEADSPSRASDIQSFAMAEEGGDYSGARPGSGHAPAQAHTRGPSVSTAVGGRGVGGGGVVALGASRYSLDSGFLLYRQPAVVSAGNTTILLPLDVASPQQRSLCASLSARDCVPPPPCGLASDTDPRNCPPTLPHSPLSETDADDSTTAAVLLPSVTLPSLADAPYPPPSPHMPGSGGKRRARGTSAVTVSSSRVFCAPTALAGPKPPPSSTNLNPDAASRTVAQRGFGQHAFLSPAEIEHLRAGAGALPMAKPPTGAPVTASPPAASAARSASCPLASDATAAAAKVTPVAALPQFRCPLTEVREAFGFVPAASASVHRADTPPTGNSSYNSPPLSPSRLQVLAASAISTSAAASCNDSRGFATTQAPPPRPAANASATAAAQHDIHMLRVKRSAIHTRHQDVLLPLATTRAILSDIGVPFLDSLSILEDNNNNLDADGNAERYPNVLQFAMLYKRDVFLFVVCNIFARYSFTQHFGFNFRKFKKFLVYIHTHFMQRQNPFHQLLHATDVVLAAHEFLINNNQHDDDSHFCDADQPLPPLSSGGQQHQRRHRRRRQHNRNIHRCCHALTDMEIFAFLFTAVTMGVAHCGMMNKGLCEAMLPTSCSPTCSFRSHYYVRLCGTNNTQATVTTALMLSLLRNDSTHNTAHSRHRKSHSSSAGGGAGVSVDDDEGENEADDDVRFLPFFSTLAPAAPGCDADGGGIPSEDDDTAGGSTTSEDTASTSESGWASADGDVGGADQSGVGGGDDHEPTDTRHCAGDGSGNGGSVNSEHGWIELHAEATDTATPTPNVASATATEQMAFTPCGSGSAGATAGSDEGVVKIGPNSVTAVFKAPESPAAMAAAAVWSPPKPTKDTDHFTREAFTHCRNDGAASADKLSDVSATSIPQPPILETPFSHTNMSGTRATIVNVATVAEANQASRSTTGGTESGSSSSNRHRRQRRPQGCWGREEEQVFTSMYATLMLATEERGAEQNIQSIEKFLRENFEEYGCFCGNPQMARGTAGATSRKTASSTGAVCLYCSSRIVKDHNVLPLLKAILGFLDYAYLFRTREIYMAGNVGYIAELYRQYIYLANYNNRDYLTHQPIPADLLSTATSSSSAAATSRQDDPNTPAPPPTCRVLTPAAPVSATAATIPVIAVNGNPLPSPERIGDGEASFTTACGSPTATTAAFSNDGLSPRESSPLLPPHTEGTLPSHAVLSPVSCSPLVVAAADGAMPHTADDAAPRAVALGGSLEMNSPSVTSGSFASVGMLSPQTEGELLLCQEGCAMTISACANSVFSHHYRIAHCGNGGGGAPPQRSASLGGAAPGRGPVDTVDEDTSDGRTSSRATSSNNGSETASAAGHGRPDARGAAATHSADTYTKKFRSLFEAQRFGRTHQLAISNAGSYLRRPTQTAQGAGRGDVSDPLTPDGAAMRESLAALPGAVASAVAAAAPAHRSRLPPNPIHGLGLDIMLTALKEIYFPVLRQLQYFIPARWVAQVKVNYFLFFPEEEAKYNAITQARSREHPSGHDVFFDVYNKHDNRTAIISPAAFDELVEDLLLLSHRSTADGGGVDDDTDQDDPCVIRVSNFTTPTPTTSTSTASTSATATPPPAREDSRESTDAESLLPLQVLREVAPVDWRWERLAYQDRAVVERIAMDALGRL